MSRRTQGPQRSLMLGGAPARDFAVNSRFAAWYGSIVSNLQPAARERPRGPKKSDKLYYVNHFRDAHRTSGHPLSGKFGSQPLAPAPSQKPGHSDYPLLLRHP